MLDSFHFMLRRIHWAAVSKPLPFELKMLPQYFVLKHGLPPKDS